MKDDINVINIDDNFGRRTGLDRRKNSGLPIEEERREGKERRSGKDRRSEGNSRSGPERRIGEIVVLSSLS